MPKDKKTNKNIQQIDDKIESKEDIEGDAIQQLSLLFKEIANNLKISINIIFILFIMGLTYLNYIKLQGIKIEIITYDDKLQKPMTGGGFDDNIPFLEGMLFGFILAFIFIIGIMFIRTKRKKKK